MKIYLLLPALFLLCISLHAQYLSTTLITPAGGLTESATGSLSWSIGEVAITHEAQGDALLTQGFQQSDFDTVLVTLPDDPKKIKILLPNLITPNADGQNDHFDPVKVLEGYQYYVPRDRTEIVIVNRWGEVVYHEKPYKAWDGGGLPQATYYFRLLRTDSKKVITEGPVHLLR